MAAPASVAFAITGATLLILALLVGRARGHGVPGVPEILQEPPEEIHPAELAVLWGSFKRQSPLLAATGVFDPFTQRALYQTELLHLAQEGVIEIQAIGPVSKPKDLSVSLRKQPEPVDAGFVQFLFAGGSGPRTLTEIATASGRGAFAGWAGGLRTKVMLGMVTTQMSGAGGPAMTIAGMVGWAMRTFVPLARQSRGWTSKLATLVGILGGVVVTVVGSGAFNWMLAAVCIIGGLLASRLMPYRVPEAFRERLARWAAFRRFLVSHADMDDAPALGVIVWEKYLVYASALQAADEVESQVRRVVPVSMMLIPWLGAGGLAWMSSIRSVAPAPVRVPRSAGLMP
ncbi:MAG: DUF2207 family protein [Actinomycetota bacterium]